jgi:regulator of nonsense transcripts 2
MPSPRTQLTADKELLSTAVPLAVAFCKHLGPLYLPQPSSEAQGPTPAEASATYGERGTIITPSTSERFRKLLAAYYEALGKRAVKDHTVRNSLVDVEAPSDDSR